MKLILSIFIIILIASDSQGQVNPNSLIKFSDLKLVKANMSSNYFIKGDPKNTIINAYGNPESIITMPWDDLDVGIDAFVYQNNALYIDSDNQKFWGFKIINTDFNISFNNHIINIGDDINTLNSIFNISFINRYDDLISVGLIMDSGVNYDYVFRISFNPSNNKITELSIGYY